MTRHLSGREGKILGEFITSAGTQHSWTTTTGPLEDKDESSVFMIVVVFLLKQTQTFNSTQCRLCILTVFEEKYNQMYEMKTKQVP